MRNTSVFCLGCADPSPGRGSGLAQLACTARHGMDPPHASSSSSSSLLCLLPHGAMSIHRVNRHKFPVLQEEFLVDSNYSFVKELGQGSLVVVCMHWPRSQKLTLFVRERTGAYGVVCAAKSQTTGDSIAIKKVRICLSQQWSYRLSRKERLAAPCDSNIHRANTQLIGSIIALPDHLHC